MVFQLRGPILQIQAKPRWPNLACAEQFLYDSPGLGDGNSETYTLGFLVDRRVDANDIPVNIEEWSATVAGVNRSIRLYEMSDRKSVV